MYFGESAKGSKTTKALIVLKRLRELLDKTPVPGNVVRTNFVQLGYIYKEKRT